MTPTPEPRDPHSDLDPTLDADTLSIRSPEATASQSPSPPPQRIGDYVIIGKLGEGGMGVVYEAQQQHPKRRVALKVVRGGHFVSEIEIKMFEREAETLARLKHPNIAAIHESGRTEDGQHFFVMELVRGETLGAYTSRHTDITVRERLRLFRQICDAVNYAHQRGVIHRDLKPSNIVVVEEEVPALPSGAAGAGSSASPVRAVKVLDFGLARIADADTAASIMTEVGAIKGTLPYMSPEQARGNPVDIDLRADVYSLGVILYEVLTGTLPYDTRASSILESMRVICEAAPRPIRNNRRGIDADLETVVLKALEKEPDHRYQSAAALSDDIDRYLASQPILARPPSTIYQIKKLVARNKLPFAFAGGVVVLLAAFGVWMSVLYSRAELARADSEAVTDFLSNMLAAVDPGKQGKDVTVREILDEAAKSVGGQFDEQPLVRARLMSTMGDVYQRLGHFSESRPLLEASLEIRKRALAPDHPDVAQSLNSLANLFRETGDYAEALPLYERALAIRETQGSDHPDVAVSLNNLAVMLYTAGDYAKAQPLFERALAIREKVLAPDHPEVAVSLGNLAGLLTATGDYAGARPLFERALEIREKALGPDHLEIAVDLTNLGVLLQETGDHEGARPLHERAFDIAVRALGPDHPDVARPLENLANVLENTGDYAGARALYDRALAIQEKALGPDHPRLLWTLNYLANLHQQSGDYAEARSLYERALPIAEKASGPDQAELVTILDGLAGTLRKLGEQAKAATLEARAKAIREKQAKPTQSQEE